MWSNECKSSVSVPRYGGLSVGGQLPILDVNPKDIQAVFRQLGQILNITGVFTSLIYLLHTHKINVSLI